MKLKTCLTVALASLAGLSAVNAAVTDGQKLTAANNDFAFKFFQQLAKEQPFANVLVSPFSAATVLQMVGNGATGQTKAEMQRVLGTTGLADAAVSAGHEAIAESLARDNSKVILTTANAIWYRQGASVKPEFVARNQKFFSATVAPLNFADPRSVDVINTWASDQTHGKITRLADGMIDPHLTRLFLANAVYFKGKWADPFKVSDTRDRPFYLHNGGQKMIPMMTQFKTFAYRHAPGYQAVRLPYEGLNLAMYVFLPETDSSLEQLLGILDGDEWQRVTRPGFTEKEGLLVLPKFKLEYSAALNEPLKSLGMKQAFDPVSADFSGIAPQLFISAARQKTFVEVKEEGTEAAAVTAVAVATSAIMRPPPDRFEMIVNRPFQFLIEDRRTGTILFMGILFDPQTN